MERKGEPIDRIKTFFDNISPHFDNWTEILQERVYGYVTWEHLKKYIPENKNALILDAGGGTGRWAIPLAKIGYKVILCDISKGMLRQAESKIKQIFNVRLTVLICVPFDALAKIFHAADRQLLVEILLKFSTSGR